MRTAMQRILNCPLERQLQDKAITYQDSQDTKDKDFEPHSNLYFT